MRVLRVARLLFVVPIVFAVIATQGGCLREVTSGTPGESANQPDKPTVDLSQVQNAPWRSEVSQAAGHEPHEKAPTLVIEGARLLIGDGTEVAEGHIVLADGKIVSVGSGAPTDVPSGAQRIDARGKVITPGLIDTHSHLGVYPTPRLRAHMDGNEMTTPVTPGSRVIDAFWPQDPGIERAVAGGTTTIQVLPGSGNLIGGRAATLKLRHATTSRAMHLRGARDGLKMACGENPKRVYGFGRKQAPMTRMGNLALQRSAFLDAWRLIHEWDSWREGERRRLQTFQDALDKAAIEKATRARKAELCESGKPSKRACRTMLETWEAEPLEEPKPDLPALPPKRDVQLETLAAVLEGRVLVHIHCYRADDMANMIALADEMGFSIRSFHHALEAYKIRDVLAASKIGVSTWADWWGFKIEAYDGIPENLAMVARAGAPAIVHSDSAEGIRRLNQEAAKGMYAGRRVAIDISEAEATTWITLNPAWALGIEERVGSLATGKDADVVIWDRTPFSVYARPEQVYIDGVLRHDVNTPAKPWSDFEAAP